MMVTSSFAFLIPLAPEAFFFKIAFSLVLIDNITILRGGSEVVEEQISKVGWSNKNVIHLQIVLPTTTLLFHIHLYEELMQYDMEQLLIIRKVW